MRMQKITLNLVPEGEKPIVYASKFDNDRVIRFDLKDGGEDYSYSGTEEFEVAIRKPDDHLVTLEAEKDSEIITIDDTPVTVYFVKVALDENSCACFGESICELKITDGDALIGSLNFVLDVERSPELNGITSTDGIHNLTTQIAAIVPQVIGDDYYDKTEVDNLLDDKADISDLPDMNNYYTKTATDNLLHNKADISDLPDMNNYYTKTATDNLLNNKADISDLPDMNNYYTKTATDNNIAALIDDTQTANNKAWSSQKISDELYALLPVGSVSGSIASFNTALAKPLVSCVVDENATKLTKSGINLWDEETRPGGYTAGVYDPTLPNRLCNTNFIKVQPGSQIFYKSGEGITVGNIFYYDIDKNYISSELNKGNAVCDIPSNCHYVNFTLATAYGTTYNHDCGINYPASYTDYHAHSETVYDIPLQSIPVTNNGVNNIYADVGDVSLTYKDTIQNYIDKNVASLQALILSI